MVVNISSLSELDWVGLSEHLLDMILYKLVSFSDYVRFGAVCKPCQSIARHNKVKFIENKGWRQVPLLLVPSKDNNDERRSLYNVTNNKLYDFQLWIPYKKRLCGSSHGWLFYKEEWFDLTLVNPFSGVKIEIPHIGRHNYYFSEAEDTAESFERTLVAEHVEFDVFKATLSADPALFPDDYMVFASYSLLGKFAYIWAGDKSWTLIDKREFTQINDVIYYRGQLLAVDYWSGILLIDLNSKDEATRVKMISPRTNEMWVDKKYLVESSSGDLLLIQKFLTWNDEGVRNSTTGFKVFKLLLDQLEKGVPKRLELKSLGGDALFLGDNNSICVSASKWPGWQPNSIYYTDDDFESQFFPPFGRHENGIFNVEDESFGSHYIIEPSHSHERMPPPIWIVPSVLGNYIN